MSKFHTKTIESILEPVAQQVSRLVEIQDDADNNYNLMPDLSQPVKCVKIAGDNLVKVGYETCDTSDDQILKNEMPNGLKRVEEACDSLEQAVELFKNSSTYIIAKKKLIDGERGIL
jgi:vinculin